MRFKFATLETSISSCFKWSTAVSRSRGIFHISFLKIHSYKNANYIFFSYRNWCAYVVTKTVSCVVEDGVETYVKPDYQPCSWGIQCTRVVV